MEEQNVKKHLGLVIRSVRKSKGYTQESVAETAGTTSNYLSLIERGIQQPTAFKLYQISKALDMQTSELFKLVEASLVNMLEVSVRDKRQD